MLRRVSCILVFTVGVGIQASSPQPVATIQIAQVTESDATPADVSPVFASDDAVAILVRSGPPREGTSRLVVFRLAGGKLLSIASTEKVNEGDRVHATGRSGVITAALSHKYLYSPDLKERREIPFRVLSGMFPRSNVIGQAEQGKWKAYRLSSPLALLIEGTGDLLSVSDDVIVFRQVDEVRIETTQGRLLGSIPVASDTKGTPVAEIAGRNRLVLSTGRMRIADFNGKELQRIDRPEGWGFRHGWSSDGSRMLFDHFTRTVSGWEKALEKAVDSLGFVIPEESNGETIRVIDSLTGKICFSLDSPGRLLGQVGGYHADLSPSGRSVAVSTLTEVSIYRLPEACTE